MYKPGWKLGSFVVTILAWRWWNTRAPTSETFYDKNVVITGGSTGIGEQIAYRFCEQGANVLIVARREPALRKVVENCTRLGASFASYIIADLQGVGNVTRVVQKEASEKFQKVDVLVLNHVLYEVKKWGADRNFDDVARAFNINVLSYIDLATLFLPSLQASRGRLVVISSGLGLVTYPYFALYCSNKHALHGFFGALRQDLALEKNDMSITMIVLGPIKTDNAVKVAIGNPVAGPNGWSRLSSVDASEAVMYATLHREREIYFPNFLRIHAFASVYFPDFTEWLIRYVYSLNS